MLSDWKCRRCKREGIVHHDTNSPAEIARRVALSHMAAQSKGRTKCAASPSEITHAPHSCPECRRRALNTSPAEASGA